MQVNVFSNEQIPSTTAGKTTLTATTNYPQPVEEEDGEVEIIIIKRRKNKPVPVKTSPFEPKPAPMFPSEPWRYDGPMPDVKWGDQREPCMFDNLPPGAYLISCPCPRHGVIC